MTRTLPHPGFLPGEKVTLEHHALGTMRLVVSHTEPATFGRGTWVVCTRPDGSGRYRRPAIALKRGWGDG